MTTPSRVLLIINANIRTMNTDQPSATSAVVVGEYFAYVGDEEGARSYVSSYCGEGYHPYETIDCQGRLLTPGFNDSHMHYILYINHQLSIELAGSTSVEEVLNRLRENLPTTPTARWLTGVRWNHDHFITEKRFPTRADLDQVSADIPIVVVRCCGHVGVLNSRALELAGVDEEFIKRYGHLIGRNEDGSLNGLLQEEALDSARLAEPPLSLDFIMDNVVSRQIDLFRVGLTSIQSDDRLFVDKSQSIEVLYRLRQLAESGALRLRIGQQTKCQNMAQLEEVLGAGFGHDFGDHRFRITSIKMFSDGSLGARTALLSRPYADDPSTRGVAMHTQEDLNAMVALAHQNNLACVIHAIGDGGLEMCLDAMERAQTLMPHLNPRHGIIHSQITTQDQIARMARMGVIAYTQPIFLDYDMHIVQDRVGKELADTSYAFRSYLTAGGHQAFGSDSPVEPFNPLFGIHCAVTRCDRSGRGPYLAHEAVTVEEALRLFTADGAYCSGEENLKGQIRPGHLADFITLDRDIVSLPHEEILKASVVTTHLGGQLVYSA